MGKQQRVSYPVYRTGKIYHVFLVILNIPSYQVMSKYLVLFIVFPLGSTIPKTKEAHKYMLEFSSGVSSCKFSLRVRYIFYRDKQLLYNRSAIV